MDLPTIVKIDDKFHFSCGCSVKHVDFVPQINIDDISVSCDSTYELLESGSTSETFQLSSNLGRHWVKEMRCRSIDDMAALTSIIRPAVLEAKLSDGKSVTSHIIKRRNNEEDVEFLDDSLKEILEPTLGAIIYQEQAMAISQKVAGFTPNEADSLRKACGKKDAKLMAQVRETFLNGCKKTGILSEEKSNELFDIIERSQRYSFNKCCSGMMYIHYTDGSKELIDSAFKNSSWKGKSSLSLKFWDRPKKNKWDTIVKNSEIIENKIVAIRRIGLRPVFRITMKRKNIEDKAKQAGIYRKHFSITVTANHKFPTRTRGEIRADELIIGEDSLYCYDPMQEYRPKYKHAASKIINIEKLGEQLCYDVEMAAPYHNFLCNGVFTCNSHAVGYGKLSYITAWMKTHFPLEFYVSALRTQEETGGKKDKKIEEKSNIIKEASDFGITIKPPTIEHPFTAYDIVNEKLIVAGISNIKSVGEKDSQIIQEYLRGHESLPNWLNVLVFLSPQINSRAFEGLCIIGFFDKVGGPTRQGKVYEYQTFKKLTIKEENWAKKHFSEFDSLESCILGLITNFENGSKDKGIANEKRLIICKDFLKTLQNPPHRLEDTPITINKAEHDLLSVPITYSDIEARTLCGIYTDTTCKEFKQGKIKKSMNLAVSIKRIKEITTKNGQKMAFLTCVDDTDELECVVFPDAYDEHSNLIQERNTVLITGERSKQQSFTIQKIIQI